MTRSNITRRRAAADQPTGTSDAPVSVLWETQERLEYRPKSVEEIGAENMIRDELDDRGISLSVRLVASRHIASALAEKTAERFEAGYGIRAAWEAACAANSLPPGTPCPAPMQHLIAARFPTLLRVGMVVGRKGGFSERTAAVFSRAAGAESGESIGTVSIGTGSKMMNYDVVSRGDGESAPKLVPKDGADNLTSEEYASIEYGIAYGKMSGTTPGGHIEPAPWSFVRKVGGRRTASRMVGSTSEVNPGDTLFHPDSGYFAKVIEAPADGVPGYLLVRFIGNGPISEDITGCVPVHEFDFVDDGGAAIGSLNKSAAFSSMSECDECGKTIYPTSSGHVVGDRRLCDACYEDENDGGTEASRRTAESASLDFDNPEAGATAVARRREDRMSVVAAGDADTCETCGQDRTACPHCGGRAIPVRAGARSMRCSACAMRYEPTHLCAMAGALGKYTFHHPSAGDITIYEGMPINMGDAHGIVTDVSYQTATVTWDGGGTSTSTPAELCISIAESRGHTALRAANYDGIEWGGEAFDALTKVDEARGASSDWENTLDAIENPGGGVAYLWVNGDGEYLVSVKHPSEYPGAMTFKTPEAAKDFWMDKTAARRLAGYSDLQSLKDEAEESAIWRGHATLTWADNGTTSSIGTCPECGMEAVVDTNPPANGIDIGGEAVALTCVGGSSNDRHAGRRTAAFDPSVDTVVSGDTIRVSMLDGSTVEASVGEISEITHDSTTASRRVVSGTEIVVNEDDPDNAWYGTLEEFVANNELEPEEVEDIKQALESGKTYYGGGGAWADWTIRKGRRVETATSRPTVRKAHNLKPGDSFDADDGTNAFSGTVKEIDRSGMVWFTDHSDGKEYGFESDAIDRLINNGHLTVTSAARSRVAGMEGWSIDPKTGVEVYGYWKAALDGGFQATGPTYADVIGQVDRAGNGEWLWGYEDDPAELPDFDSPDLNRPVGIYDTPDDETSLIGRVTFMRLSGRNATARSVTANWNVGDIVRLRDERDVVKIVGTETDEDGTVWFDVADPDNEWSTYGDLYSADSFEEYFPESESEWESQGPEDDDITTEDHRRFYQNGRLVVEVEDGEDWEPAVRDYMNRSGWFPNIWFISDHGNAHLLTAGRKREAWDSPVAKTKIVKNNDGEWVVKAYDAAGNRMPNSDYYASDKDDAEQTSKLMVNASSADRMVRASESASA